MFRVIVNPGGGRSVKTQECSSGFSGKKRFFILCNTDTAVIKFTSDDSQPVAIHGASWEGFYTTRNQGIG